jgi:hypothetical protein
MRKLLAQLNSSEDACFALHAAYEPDCAVHVPRHIHDISDCHISVTSLRAHC